MNPAWHGATWSSTFAATCLMWRKLPADRTLIVPSPKLKEPALYLICYHGGPLCCSSRYRTLLHHHGAVGLGERSRSFPDVLLLEFCHCPAKKSRCQYACRRPCCKFPSHYPAFSKPVEEFAAVLESRHYCEAWPCRPSKSRCLPPTPSVAILATLLLPTTREENFHIAALSLPFLVGVTSLVSYQIAPLLFRGRETSLAVSDKRIRNFVAACPKCCRSTLLLLIATGCCRSLLSSGREPSTTRKRGRPVPNLASLVREQCNAAILGVATHFLVTQQLDVRLKSRPSACPHHPIAGAASRWLSEDRTGEESPTVPKKTKRVEREGSFGPDCPVCMVVSTVVSSCHVLPTNNC